MFRLIEETEQKHRIFKIRGKYGKEKENNYFSFVWAGKKGIESSIFYSFLVKG